MQTRSRSVAALAALLLLGACDSPNAPDRSSFYDFRLSPSDPVFHWPATALPVRFYADQVGALPEYVALGVRMWERQFLYGEFRGELVSDSADADVILSLQGSAPPDGPLTDDPPVTSCTGVTSVPPTTELGSGQLVYTERFQVQLQWFSRGSPSDIANCLARVTAHEIGHTLGVFNHSPTPDDLMARSPTAREPTARDRATVQILYHVRSDILPFSHGLLPP